MVVLTGVSGIHTVHRAEQLGAKAYLVKATFSVAEMLRHVKRYTAHASEDVQHQQRRDARDRRHENAPEATSSSD